MALQLQWLLSLVVAACVAAAGEWETSYPPWNTSSSRPRLRIPIVVPLTNHGCGPSRYMSMRIAVSHANRRDGTLAPALGALRNDFEIEYVVLDNKASSVGTLDALIKLQAKLGGVLKVVLGPNGSGSSKAASPFLAVFGVPLMSWAATSADLSNKAAYPNFFRVVSPDSLRMKVLVRFIGFMSLRSFNIIFTDTAYTTGEKEQALVAVSELNAEDATLGFEVAAALKVPEADGAVDLPVLRSVLRLVKQSVVRVVVVSALNEASFAIFREAEQMAMMSTGYLWLGADSLSDGVLGGEAGRVATLHGTLNIMASAAGAGFGAFQDLWRALMPATATPEFDSQPEVCGGVVCSSLRPPAGGFRGWNAGSEDTSLLCSGYTPLAYDAVVTLAVVADELLTAKGLSDPEALTAGDWMTGLRALTSRTEAIMGLSGEVSFNANQERDMPMIIRNWQAGRASAALVATWSGLRGFRWQVGEQVFWPGIQAGVTVTDATIRPSPPGVDLGVPLPCSLGEIFDTNVGDCRPCAPGTYAPRLEGPFATQCVRCGAGTFADEPGLTECKRCAAGFAAELGSELCSPCEAGRFSAAGADACTACPSGTFTMHNASGSCSICPPGSQAYSGSEVCTPCAPGHSAEAAGSAVCLACPAGTVAAEPGQSACTWCPQGSYASLTGGTACSSCGNALIGSTTRLLGAVSQELCVCPEGSYRELRQRGACRRCEGFLFTSAALSMAVNLFFTMGVFGTLSLSWPEPLGSFFSSIQVVTLDFQSLGLGCLMTDAKYSGQYVGKLLVYPILMGLVCAVSFAMNLVPQLQPLSGWRKEAMLNTSGGILSGLFVLVGLVSLDGLRCISNPNGLSTLRADTSIVCWVDGGHSGIAALSFLALCVYPLLFLALTFRATFWYGPLVLTYGTRFTAATRFLTNRMAPKQVLFSFLLNVRNFLISLIPAVVADSFQDKVFLLMLIFIIWGFAQNASQCWRFRGLNLLDSAVTAVMCCGLVAIALLGNSTQELHKDRLSWCLIGTSCMAFLGLLVAVVSQAFRGLSGGKVYSVFISHHKAAAGVFARHVKLLLQSPKLRPPFLDVDQLDDLHNLALCVQASQRVLIIATPDIFLRPWCALEVATASAHKLPMVIGVVGEEPALKAEKLLPLLQGFSSSDRGVLSQAGVTMDQVAAAYSELQHLTKVLLPLKTLEPAVIKDAVGVILGKEACRWSPPLCVPERNLLAYMVFDTYDDETWSVVQIMSLLLQQEHWVVVKCHEARETVKDGRGVGIVFLSKGLVHDTVAVGHIMSLRRHEQGFVTVTCSEGFARPSQDWFAKIRDGSAWGFDWKSILDITPACTLEQVECILNGLYRVLAVRFLAEQNEKLLREELRLVERRAAMELEKGADGMSRTSSNFSLNRLNDYLSNKTIGVVRSASTRFGRPLSSRAPASSPDAVVMSSSSTITGPGHAVVDEEEMLNI